MGRWGFAPLRQEEEGEAEDNFMPAPADFHFLRSSFFPICIKLNGPLDLIPLLFSKSHRHEREKSSLCRPAIIMVAQSYIMPPSLSLSFALSSFVDSMLHREGPTVPTQREAISIRPSAVQTEWPPETGWSSTLNSHGGETDKEKEREGIFHSRQR